MTVVVALVSRLLLFETFLTRSVFFLGSLLWFIKKCDGLNYTGDPLVVVG